MFVNAEKQLLKSSIHSFKKFLINLEYIILISRDNMYLWQKKARFYPIKDRNRTRISTLNGSVKVFLFSGVIGCEN